MPDENITDDPDMERADVANGEGDPEATRSSDRREPPSDPDAAGTGVDDEGADEVPEPNEPA